MALCVSIYMVYRKLLLWRCSVFLFTVAVLPLIEPLAICMSTAFGKARLKSIEKQLNTILQILRNQKKKFLESKNKFSINTKQTRLRIRLK